VITYNLAIVYKRHIMKAMRVFNSTAKAQTAVELAVFGAVLIFLLGLMIRYSLNAALAQSQTLKAMRLAMAESFKAGENRTAGRNTATLIFVEDRTTAEVTKYGAISRSPAVASGSATFSKNLFLPLDWGEFQNIPLTDVFINGQHFALTTAGFKEYNIGEGSAPPVTLDSLSQTRWDADWDPGCSSSGGCRMVYTRVPNLPDSTDFDVHCDPCFDLYRDGSNIVPASERPLFAWQWKKIKATSDNINIKDGKNTVVDLDGDLQEEFIIEMVDVDGFTYTSQQTRKNSGDIPIKTVRVLDFQAGDMDLSHNDRSVGPKPGLQDNLQMYTFARDGTVLFIEEGKLKETTQMVRSTQTKDITDIISRTMQLTNDTGRLCGNGSGEPWDVGAGVPNSQLNPAVKACNDCFSDANIFQTCFDEGVKILYIRSRIGDLRGRRWVTDLGERGY